jgi:Tol biopolymer transport system component
MMYHLFSIVVIVYSLIQAILPAQQTSTNWKIAFQSDRENGYGIYTMNPDGSNVRRITNDTVQNGTAAWSPDGKKIVYVSRRNGQSSLYTMNIDGTNQRYLANTDKKGSWPAWSPDGRHIAFTTNIAVHIIDADGTNERKLLEGNLRRPTWSPDGKQIAVVESPRAGTGPRFGTTGYKIMLIDIDSGKIKNVTDEEGIFDPILLPDGKSIAFNLCDSQTGQLCGLYLISTDGKNRRLFLSGRNTHCSWSFDGKLIVCDSYDAKKGWHIFTMTGSGGNRRVITGYNAPDVYPSWSPDAKQILFTSGRDRKLDLFTMNPDGSDAQKLDTELNQPTKDRPLKSPDGTYDLYVSNQGGDFQIYVSDKTAISTQLTRDSNIKPSHAGWSEDSKQILFIGMDKKSKKRNLYAINVDGKNRQRLISATGENLAWSPDRKHFAFDIDGSLNVIDSNGKNLRKIAKSKNKWIRFDWSPDNQRVAFETERSIFITDLTGKSQRNVTFNVAKFPKWSPDGKSILFVMEISVYLVDIQTSQLKYLASLDQTYTCPSPTWTPDSQKVVFSSAREGNPEIYMINADGSDLRNLSNSAADDWCPTIVLQE